MNTNRRVGQGNNMMIGMFIFMGLIFAGTGVGLTVFFAFEIAADRIEGAVLIFSLIFAAVGLAMMGVAVRMVVKSIRESRIAKNGKEATGTYIDHRLSHTNNNTAMFRVEFSYTDEAGNLQVAKTRAIFRGREAMALAYIGQFPIRYSGSVAVIMLTKGELLRQQQNQDFNFNSITSLSNQHHFGMQQGFGGGVGQMQQAPQSRTCGGCGSPRTSDARFCDFCGSKFV